MFSTPETSVRDDNREISPFTGLRKALVLSRSECDFLEEKNERLASEDVYYSC